MNSIKRLTILIDMDDVLENLVECWVAALNRKHGDLPGPHRHAAFQVLPGRGALRRRQLGFVLRDGPRRLLRRLHPRGRHGGDGEPGPLPPREPHRRHPEEMTP